jgi:hypothetical protein
LGALVRATSGILNRSAAGKDIELQKFLPFRFTSLEDSTVTDTTCGWWKRKSPSKSKMLTTSSDPLFVFLARVTCRSICDVYEFSSCQSLCSALLLRPLLIGLPTLALSAH